jgi:hypothetical protein
LVGGGELRYDPKSGMHFIRLGEKRLENLYHSSLTCKSIDGIRAYKSVCALAA